MKKILVLILALGLLIIAGCATSSGVSSGKTAEKSSAVGASEQKTSEEKVPVTETVTVPYLVRSTSHFNDGYVESYKVYSFNDDMSPAREDLFDSFDEIIESVVYETVSASEVKRSLYNARGELQSWKKIVSNEDGKPLRIESYTAEDALQTVSEYVYDEDGNKVSWKVYDGGGVILSETRYIYEGGNNTRIEIYDASMKMREYFEKSYTDGLLSENRHYDENGKILATFVYSYADGALIEEKHLRANGSTSVLIKYTNDSYGSPVKQENYDGDGKLKDWNEMEYEYVSEDVTVWK